MPARRWSRNSTGATSSGSVAYQQSQDSWWSRSEEWWAPPEERTYDSGWFKFEDSLGAILGTWQDQAGAVYRVEPDGESATSCTVRTTRDGRERITKALIKCAGTSARNSTGRVVWGQGYELETFKGRPDSIRWIPRADQQNLRPYTWKRLEGPAASAAAAAEPARVVEAAARQPRNSVGVCEASAWQPRLSMDPGRTPGGRRASAPGAGSRKSEGWGSAPTRGLRAWADDEDAEEQDEEEQRWAQRRSLPRRSVVLRGSDEDDWLDPPPGIARQAERAVLSGRTSTVASGRPSTVASGRPSVASQFTPEELATFSLRQEKLEVQEATLKVREATVTIKEAAAAEAALEIAREERSALAREVSALTKKRIAEQEVVEGHRQEQERMKAKLMRVREVVAVTVGRMDLMLEGGSRDDRARATLLEACEQAKAAAEEAGELLKTLEGEGGVDEAQYESQDESRDQSPSR